MTRLWLELAGIAVVIAVPLLAADSVASVAARQNVMSQWVFILLFFAGIAPILGLRLLLAMDRIRRARLNKNG
jgi:hypothetical protein